MTTITERLAEMARTARMHLAALIPNPGSVNLDDWPCANPADRDCMQTAYECLTDGLAEYDAMRAAEGPIAVSDALFGWAVVDSRGCAERVISRVHYEFNARAPVIRAGVAEDITAYLDREYCGCAPHRIIALYTTAPAAAQDAGDARDAARYRWLRARRKDGPAIAYNPWQGHGGLFDDDADDVVDAAIAAMAKDGAK